MSLASYVPIVGTAKAKRKIKYQNNSMMTYLNYQKIKPSNFCSAFYGALCGANSLLFTISLHDIKEAS